jgi:hypothetical protein
MFVNVDDACLKFQLMNVNEKELKNQQMCWNSSIKYYWWMVEIFGFWHKQIHVDPSKNEHNVLDLVDMLAMLILQMAQKDGNLHPPTKYAPSNLIW